MLIQYLLILVMLSLILPIVQLFRVHEDTGNWKHNLVRLFYGNLSGLIILGATLTGHQHLGTNSPSIVFPLDISLVILIVVLTDLYRAENKYEEAKRSVFYSAIFLAVCLQLFTAILNLF